MVSKNLPMNAPQKKLQKLIEEDFKLVYCKTYFVFFLEACFVPSIYYSVKKIRSTGRHVGFVENFRIMHFWPCVLLCCSKSAIRGVITLPVAETRFPLLLRDGKLLIYLHWSCAAFVFAPLDFFG